MGEGATTGQIVISGPQPALEKGRTREDGSQKQLRDISLDVLRAVAILLVIVSHLKHPAAPGSATGWLAKYVFDSGAFGVDLFFVLSGFLIGGLLLNEYRADGCINVGRFLVRRGFKIYPLYYFFIAYLLLMPGLKALVAGKSVVPIASDWFQDYWPNLLFVNNYLGNEPVGHTWSLAVEEHFYILLPLVMVALSRWWRMRWVPVMGIALVLGCFALRFFHVAMGVHSETFLTESQARIDSLFCGVMLRYFDSKVSRPASSFRVLGVVMVVLGFAGWYGLNRVLNLSDRWMSSLGVTLRTIEASLVLYGTWMNRQFLGQLSQKLSGLPLKWLAAIGTCSYGIYVWHVTAMRGMEKYVGGGIRGYFGVSETSWVVEALIYSASALILGIMMTRLVEIPFLRLRDKVVPSRIRAINAVATRNPA